MKLTPELRWKLNEALDSDDALDAHDIDVVRDALYELPNGHVFTDHDLADTDIYETPWGRLPTTDEVVRVALDYYGIEE